MVSYSKLVCALLDVPVYSDSSLIESLHLLFTLYLSFKNNPYFGMQAGSSTCGSGSGSGPHSTISG